MEQIQSVLTDSSKDLSITQTCCLITASVFGLRRSFLTGLFCFIYVSYVLYYSGYYEHFAFSIKMSVYVLDFF